MNLPGNRIPPENPRPRVRPPRTRPTRRHLLRLTAAAVALCTASVLAGVLLVAPSTVDLRNACVARDVVGHAGLPKP